jgi:hypothetical protein
MELLLNLLWLTLALPALWMWRRESVFAQGHRRRFDGVRPFVILGCVLMLLFPVVSATDDLHAMRQEMEESSPSKRMVKQIAGEKSLPWLGSPGTLPALIFPVPYCPNHEAGGQILVMSALLPQQTHFSKRVSRGPPSLCHCEYVGFAA